MYIQHYIKKYICVYTINLAQLYVCLIKKHLQTSYFIYMSNNMMKFDDKNFIAQQIKLHRKKAGMTQEELAEKVDLSVQHISRIESACYVPSLKSFFMIASVLKIDLQVFGYNVISTTNNRKNDLIKKIISATDAEMIFYENLTSAITDSLAKIKQELL